MCPCNETCEFSSHVHDQGEFHLMITLSKCISALTWVLQIKSSFNQDQAMQRVKKLPTGKPDSSTAGRIQAHAQQQQQQQQPQQQQQQQPSTTAKSNQPIQLKPTDQSIPPCLKEHFPEKVELYEQLQNRERLLDIMINRKLLDLQDHQQRITTNELSGESNEETLRIFIYNTSENQPWQRDANQQDVPSEVHPDPSWTLRIEGRLLNDKTLLTDSKRHKMSWFLSGLSVELKPADGDESRPLVLKGVNAPGLNGSSDTLIEWHDDIKLPEAERVSKQFDGMDIRRGGSSIPGSTDDLDREIVANIVIQPKQYPIKLMVNDKSLMELVGAREITQAECIKRIFYYAKVNQLFDVQTVESDSKDLTNKSSKKIVTIKSDELLMKIFGLPIMTMPQIMEIVGNKLLKPVEPVRINYRINTLKSTTLGEVVVDIKVNRAMLGKKKVNQDLEDINRLITEDVLNKQSLAELIKLDENLKLNIQILNYSKMKYDFYKKFSENPAEFLKQVLQKNEEYLKILSSDSMSFGKDGLVSEELVRKSDFYTDDFLKQHINLLLNSGRI